VATAWWRTDREKTVGNGGEIWLTSEVVQEAQLLLGDRATTPLSAKVVDFGTNRKRVYDFLLVINSNLCRISHRFGDTAAYWSKILIQRPRSGWSPSNFGMHLISAETRMMGLPYGEEIMIVGRTMWTQCTSVTDRRTDRQNYDRKYRATHSVAR